MLTTSSWKHLDDISHAHIVCLVYKLITSARDIIYWSIGFDGDWNRRQWELSKNKSERGKYQIKNYLTDIFGSVEHRENATLGLGFKLTLRRKSYNAGLNNDNAINIGKIKLNSFERYLLHYTPSIPQKTILSKQFPSKIPTELQSVESLVFIKEVNTQKLWNFELGIQEGYNVPLGIVVVFGQRERQDS